MDFLLKPGTGLMGCSLGASRRKENLSNDKQNDKEGNSLQEGLICREHSVEFQEGLAAFRRSFQGRMKRGDGEISSGRFPLSVLLTLRCCGNCR